VNTLNDRNEKLRLRTATLTDETRRQGFMENPFWA